MRLFISKIENNNPKYYYISSHSEVAVNPIFNSMMNNIKDLIGDNLELQNLVSKNISVGKKLFTHPLYLYNLRENSLFKN